MPNVINPLAQRKQPTLVWWGWTHRPQWFPKPKGPTPVQLLSWLLGGKVDATDPETASS